MLDQATRPNPARRTRPSRLYLGQGDTHAERDYVLGTHDDEIYRLGYQHRVWRPRALDAWARARMATARR